MSATPHPLLREWLIAAAVGVPCLGVVLVTNRTASTGLILAHAALLLWFVPLVGFCMLRYRPVPERPSAELWYGLGLRLIAVLVGSLLTLVVLRWVTGIALRALVVAPLFSALLPVMLAYLLVASLEHGSRVRRHAALLEAAEARAREAALIARIRPHFLFNALNCIEQLTVDEPARARTAVVGLARLLRGVLHGSNSLTLSLDQELALVHDYLLIEQMRFGSRLTMSIDVEPSARLWKVPATVVLTLTENAVKHGVETTSKACAVRIVARVDSAGKRVIRVSSPKGHVVFRREDPGSGYGLVDVRQRLDLLYPGQATMTLQEGEEDVHAELCLPA